MAPDWLLPEDSAVFWYSYVSPYEGCGILIRSPSDYPTSAVCSVLPSGGSWSIGSACDKLLLISEGYRESVRKLVKQPVLWGAWFNWGSESGFLFGPADRFGEGIWISQDLVTSSKTVLEGLFYGLEDTADFAVFSDLVPRWSPCWSGSQGLGLCRNWWIDTMYLIKPVPGDTKKLYWMHDIDDQFSYRVDWPMLGSSQASYFVYLYPQQDIDEVEVSEISTLPSMVSSLPSPGVMVAMAGGALGLGYSLTKLVK
jgi:hypothetical protein